MGRLIVCEGLDASGKTTVIKELLKKYPSCSYSKGMGSDTFIGRIARKFPSTFLFFLELIYINHKLIRPNLLMNRLVLQDRYDLSIITHKKAQRFYNLAIGKVLRPLVAKAETLVYFEVSLEERIRRLRSDDPNNRFHKELANHPKLIVWRVKKYLREYERIKGLKTRLDTSILNPK